MRKIMAVNCVSIALLVGVTTGCSSGRPPLEKISVAEQAFKQAEDKEARRYSPLEMRLAFEKIESSKEAVRDENFELARRLVEEAEIDALVAEAKADSIRAGEAVKELNNSIESLKQEIKRKNGQ